MDWRTVAVALTLVLAGCSTFASPSTPSETVTPAPVPTTSPEPPTEAELAPGVGVRGSFDATRLAEAHGTAAANRSYVWQERLNVSSSNGTAPLTVDSQLRVETDQRYWFRTSPSGEFWHQSEFANGTDRYQRLFVQGGVEIRQRPMTTASEEFVPLATRAISDYLAVDEVSVSRSSANGDSVYVIRADSDTVRGQGAVQNYSAQATLTPEGFVYSLRVRYVSVDNGQRQLVRYRMGYDQVDNATVERPDWVDAAG